MPLACDPDEQWVFRDNKWASLTGKQLLKPDTLAEHHHSPVSSPLSSPVSSTLTVVDAHMGNTKVVKKKKPNLLAWMFGYSKQPSSHALGRRMTKTRKYSLALPYIWTLTSSKLTHSIHLDPTTHTTYHLGLKKKKPRSCDIDLACGASSFAPFLATNHAVLTYRQQLRSWVVMDSVVKASKGVFVNGVKVREAVLKEGDVVCFGGGSKLMHGSSLLNDASPVCFSVSKEALQEQLPPGTPILDKLHRGEEYKRFHRMCLKLWTEVGGREVLEEDHTGVLFEKMTKMSIPLHLRESFISSELTLKMYC